MDVLQPDVTKARASPLSRRPPLPHLAPGATLAAFTAVPRGAPAQVGGISEEYKIGLAAYDAHVRMVPHGWNTAAGLAADLQLAASLPTVDLVEYITPAPYIEERAWHSRHSRHSHTGLRELCCSRPPRKHRVQTEGVSRYRHSRTYSRPVPGRMRPPTATD